MAKLHELLAVEQDLEAIARKIIEETFTTFIKKPHLFMGYHKRLEIFSSQDQNEAAAPDEYKELDDTVASKLEYTAGHVIRYLDAHFQKEATNQKATADLVIGGQVFVENAPATWLLGLETRLKNLRRIYESTPTLAPGIKWTPDPDKGQGVYSAVKPEVNYKTAKTYKSKILVEPTEHHPAQVEKWTENINIGRFVKNIWSGMVTPAQKSAMLERLDTLILETKKARTRANQQEVEKCSIGRVLFDYIHGNGK